MHAARSSVVRHSKRSRAHYGAPKRILTALPTPIGSSLLFAVKGFPTRAPANSRPAAAQKDMTAELLERAFSLALSVRLKQHAGIHIDVRSTAWGLMEGKVGGMTVSGYEWRTPLELTAEQIMVDVGELALDYPKLVWQQTVALKNVPQGSVAFTLTSQDLANFMVHPIMVAAAASAVQGRAFIFDRNTARVQLNPATGRGVITYQGIWAGDGQRYAVTMSTPPPPPQQQQQPAAAAVARGGGAAAAAARRGGGSGVAAVVASSNTLEQLTVSARRMKPLPTAGATAAAAARSTTGSFASASSFDDSLAAAAAAGAAVAARAGSGPAVSGRMQTLTVAAPPPAAAAVAAAVAAAAAGAAILSSASAGSMDPLGEGEVEGEGETGAESDPGAVVVAEGLRRFFSSLVINLQGIELRNPVLLVQLPGPGVGAAAAAGAKGAQRAEIASNPRASPTAAGSAGPAAGVGSESGAAVALDPALLTITMRVAILQLPPLNMKF